MKMKLIIFILCIINTLNAQINSRKLKYFYNEQYPSTPSLRYVIDSEVCLNQKIYQQLKLTFNLMEYCIFNKNEEIWYLRTDSSKTFIYYPKVNVEKLLYDFGAKKGDTICISPPGYSASILFIDSMPGPEQKKVVRLDTTILYENTYRKTIYFENDTIVWIEGIGVTNAVWLDPFGKRRFVNPSYDRFEMLGVITNDSLTLFNPNPLLWKTSYLNVWYSCKKFNPFYLYQHCDTPSIVDTIQLDRSRCSYPATYQNFTIKQDKINGKCRDTIKLSLDIQYAPPSFTYKFIPDSFVVLNPPYDSMKTTLYTFVADSVCNKKIVYYPTHQCDICRDSIYKLNIVSNKPLDTFYCPDSIKRNYTVLSGNFDTSFSWKFLKPLPIIYGNLENYAIKVIAKNQYCIDTFISDTLQLYCNDKCKFTQIPCINLMSDKAIARINDTIHFSHSCISNCVGYQYQWAKGNEIEIIPSNFTDSVLNKKLYYWNSFSIVDSASLQVKIDYKSLLSRPENNLWQWRIEKNILYIENNNEPLSLKIIDLLGQVKIDQKVIQSLDLNGISNGIYLLQIGNSISNLISKKFVYIHE
jgi:hypothetical protein